MDLARAIDLFLRERYCGATNIEYEEAAKTVETYLKTTYWNECNTKIYNCSECLDHELQPLLGHYCKNWKTHVDGKGCFHGRKIGEYNRTTAPYLQIENK